MAEARWYGKLRDGRGEFKSATGQVFGPFSFASRFESGVGTNPEELIASALASCFSMALAARLTKERFVPEWIHSYAQVFLDKTQDGEFALTKIEIRTEGSIPGIEAEMFQRMAEEVKNTCPVSKALSGVQIILRTAMLVVSSETQRMMV
ncbi:MAG: OsmC family peroxiredoxin [Bdellovibrionota bacterium]